MADKRLWLQIIGRIKKDSGGEISGTIYANNNLEKLLAAIKTTLVEQEQVNNAGEVTSQRIELTIYPTADLD